MPHYEVENCACCNPQTWDQEVWGDVRYRWCASYISYTVAGYSCTPATSWYTYCTDETCGCDAKTYEEAYALALSGLGDDDTVYETLGAAESAAQAYRCDMIDGDYNLQDGTKQRCMWIAQTGPTLGAPGCEQSGGYVDAVRLISRYQVYAGCCGWSAVFWMPPFFCPDYPTNSRLGPATPCKSYAQADKPESISYVSGSGCVWPTINTDNLPEKPC